MRRTVIESPYAGDVEQNVRYAKRCVLDCLRRGEAPYASHLFFTQPGLLDDAVYAERQAGMAAGFAWGEAADTVAFYIDRDVSYGMQQGYKRALDRVGALEIEVRSVGGELTLEEIGHWRERLEGMP